MRLRRGTAPALSRDDAPAEAARIALGFHLRAFRHEEGGARAGDVEGVHQLRVATRRLRAALDLFAPVLPAAAARSAHASLTWVAGAIGAVRDLDVLSAAIGQHARRLDADLREALTPLEHVVGTRRADAHATLVAALDARRCRGVLARLEALAERVPAARPRGTLGALAPDLVRPLVRAFLRAGRRVEEESSPRRIHRLRVRGKRLRYALETLGLLGGGATSKARRRLERLQDVLGEHQDAVTQGAWLRDCVQAERLPAVTVLATGALVALLGRRARRLRRRLPAQWKRLGAAETWREVAAELGRRRAAARAGDAA